MHKFIDTSGKEWPLVITIGHVKRVRNALGVDLTKVIVKNDATMSDESVLVKLTDPILLVDVLYVLVKPLADERQITDEQFGESLDGDVVAAATAALLEALCDFFPNPQRAVLRKILDNSRKMQALVDAELVLKADEAIASTFGKSSTPPPEESVSPPTHSLSAS